MTQNPLVIYSINGPVVTLRGRTPLQMMEMVYVGHGHLIGEVINVSDEKTTIQVYESTTGLRRGTGRLDRRPHDRDAWAGAAA